MITFEKLNDALEDALDDVMRRAEKRRKDFAINAAQELRKALDELEKEQFQRTGICWDCKHYDREEEECLLIKGQFGEDILGGHEACDFCSKIERRERNETD